MASYNIINVSDGDFEYEVLAYSHQTAVVVDFWAEWCVPCHTLGPMLERLAREAQGAFRLAKVDVDANQKLATQYHVHGIPAVKAFRDGNIVSEFTGLIPEQKLKEFVRALVPSEVNLTLEKASNLYAQQQFRGAEQAYREVLAKEPEHPAARLGLAKSLLIQGKTGESLNILKSFPPSREFNAAQNLLPLAFALDRAHEGVGNAVNGDDALDAAFDRSIRLVERGNIPAALDGLLDILREDKRYRDGEVRKVFLSLLELLGEENPLTRQYRQELSSVLF
jgi:putative thioredoxin